MTPGKLITSMSFALIWTAAITAGAGLELWRDGWDVDERLTMILTPYFLGSLVGGFFCIQLASQLKSTEPRRRFIIFFLLLAVFTIAGIVLAFALQYRLYFSQRHAEFPTLAWFVQTFFTVLGSVYLFASTGLRALVPWGLLSLVCSSFVFSRGWMFPSR